MRLAAGLHVTAPVSCAPPAAAVTAVVPDHRHQVRYDSHRQRQDPGHVAVPQGSFSLVTAPGMAHRRRRSRSAEACWQRRSRVSAVLPATLQIGLLNPVVQKTFKIVSQTTTPESRSHLNGARAGQPDRWLFDQLWVASFARPRLARYVGRDVRPLRLLQLRQKDRRVLRRVVRSADALPENYNTAPTNDIYGVVAGPDGQPALQVFHWGLVPVWAKDIKIGSKMINARSETLADKPAFKSVFKKQRIIIPMDGFYEWQQGSEGAVADQGRQAGQAADVHPSPRRRAAGRRRAVDDVARQDGGPGCAVAAQLHHRHHVGQRRRWRPFTTACR